MRTRIVGFSVVFSLSDFISCEKEFARHHGWQAKRAKWAGGGPVRAEQVGFGDSGETWLGDSGCSWTQDPSFSQSRPFLACFCITLSVVGKTPHWGLS